MSMITAKNEKDKTVTIDGVEHKVIYPATQFFDGIHAGDEVEVRFDNKPEQNITFIRKFNIAREGDIISGQSDEYGEHNERRNDLDPMRPLGNLYAMCEEKLNVLIQQNSTNNALLFEIAKKVGVDLDLPSVKDDK